MLDSFLQLIPFLVIGGIVYLANLQQAEVGRGTPLLRGLLIGAALLPVLYVGMALFGSLTPSTDSPLPEISAVSGGIALLIAALLCGFSFVVMRSQPLRESLRRVFDSAYDPQSIVHLTAIVLMLALTSVTVSDFVLSGGISGLAASLEANQSAIPDLILTQMIWILTALLGVGMLIRRSPQQAAKRLGLRFPKPEDFNWGLGFGLLCFIGVSAFGVIWMLLTSPEQFAEQTAASQQLSSIFSSLPQAFILSILIGIGEEMFFRGALQPVFGNGFTSIFFAILHTQYTLTPATLALFGVSLVLGWLRRRQSTSASIIAHFIYNFVQLALGILISTP